MKIIAEAAFNHNGDLNYLKELGLKSKISGADYFTVQVMNVDAFCVKDYLRYKLYKDTEFNQDQWIDLFDYYKDIDLPIIPCVLEEKSFQLCINYGFKLLKIHATDITNHPFLNLISESPNIKVILETQCATLLETELAIEILGKHKIEALFSGYSNYPTEVEDLNLNTIDYFKHKFNLNVGYADHSLDTSSVPLMILAKGCKYIEKHITISRNNRNYDWQVSLYPEEFSKMVNNLKHYAKSLGSFSKHPSENEKNFRSVMYKKHIDGFDTLKRSDKGYFLIEKIIDSFSSESTVVALIARLKSKRLKNKVLKPFHNNVMILDLYNRISRSKKYKTILATSNLIEDKDLVNLFYNQNIDVFKGDPISVIDRMLSLAYQEKASSIFRVTGDNPFTDPRIMEEMLSLMNEHSLDYVKVNNVPFGVGSELFSTKYLWKLYLELDTTEFSEYLTWYVLNDKDVKIGSIDLVESNNDNYLVNLSVDLLEDFDRCKKLLLKIGKKDFNNITLQDILSNTRNLEKVNDNKIIKLPHGMSMKLKDYIKSFNEKKYIIRKKITL